MKRGRGSGKAESDGTDAQIQALPSLRLILGMDETEEEKTVANMGTNTTTTMKKTSVVLAGKCAKTQASLRKLMSDAGCADGETIKVNLPLAPASKDDVVFAGLNGVSFYFQRGKTVEMPAAVAEILKNCGEM